jgi:quinol monooxygenase YgiN
MRPLRIRIAVKRDPVRRAATVSQPFIFISTFRLEQGKLDAFKEMCKGLAEMVASNEPRLIAFNLYASEDGTEVSNVQVHPDADSMATHLQLLREHISGAVGEEGPIDLTVSNQIFGTPNDAVLQMFGEFDPGVPMTVKPLPVAGFTRSAAE